MELNFSQDFSFRYGPEHRIVTTDGGIYYGQDNHLGRHVAIKHVRLLGDTPAQRRESLDKAMSEVTAMVRASEVTTRIPKFYTTYYDEEKGELYIIMERIHGKTLTQRMVSCSGREILRWMATLADILDAMSRIPMSHKDIKPDNLMVTSTGDLYLIDFNISLSLPNTIEGTVHYKAPETDSTAYAERSKVDMFAIGVILYQYFTKVLPQLGQQYKKPLLGKGWKDFTHPNELNSAIDEAIDTIICTCMERDPNRRYGSYHELANALREAAKSYGKQGKRK